MKQTQVRGMSISKKEWVYGQLIISDKIAFIITKPKMYDYTGDDDNDLTFYRWHEVIPESVGEYTGLLDKNRKEIYQGDVVKIDGSLYHVKWDNFSWNFEKTRSYMVYQHYDRVFGTDVVNEIVGNAYEIPELINEIETNIGNYKL